MSGPGCGAGPSHARCFGASLTTCRMLPVSLCVANSTTTAWPTTGGFYSTSVTNALWKHLGDERPLQQLGDERPLQHLGDDTSVLCHCCVPQPSSTFDCPAPTDLRLLATPFGSRHRPDADAATCFPPIASSKMRPAPICGCVPHLNIARVRGCSGRLFAGRGLRRRGLGPPAPAWPRPAPAEGVLPAPGALLAPGLPQACPAAGRGATRTSTRTSTTRIGWDRSGSSIC